MTGLSFFCAALLTIGSLASADFKLRDYKLDTLDNGLQVISIETKTLPAVSIGLMIKEGAASDLMGQSGITNLLAEVMVKGTKSLGPTELADTLGKLGTEIESSAEADYMWFQVSGLAPHFQKLLDIFGDVILHPSLTGEELDRQKKIVLAEIKQRVDHPEKFAAESFMSYLYGGHPYGRPSQGLAIDIPTIDRKDLATWYDKKIKPNNAVLVITGQLPPNYMDALKTVFGAWPKGDVETKAFPQAPAFTGTNLRVIDKPDLNQTQIVLGALGIKRNNPDYIALRVANNILGGNFSSRLMDQVRVNLGLTYGISSFFDARLDRGPFVISTFTKNASVGAATRETLSVFRKFVTEGVTKEEVDGSKNYLKGTFPRAIETPERLGFNLALLRLYGVSDDYLKNFVSSVDRLSVADVNDAIKKYFPRDSLKVLVLTKKADTLEQVRPFGLVEVKSFNP